MSKKITLEKIIKDFLAEKGIQHDEGIVRTLRRNFYKLLDNVGGSKDEMKGDARIISFEESEISFMKTII